MEQGCWRLGAPPCVLAGTVFRVGGLVVGCVATGLAFSSDAFSISGQTFKEVFNYSQTEVELIMSMAMLGLVSAWPSSLLLHHWGPRWLSLAALVITSGGCCLVVLAVHLHVQFSDKAYLVALFFLVIGIGNGTMYITATTVNLMNFEGRWLGLVSGLLHSVKSILLGVLLLAFDWLVRKLEVSPHPQDPPPMSSKVEVLKDYMIMLTCMYAITNLMAVIFYGDYRMKADTSRNKDGDVTLKGNNGTELIEGTLLLTEDKHNEKGPIIPGSRHTTSSQHTYNSTCTTNLDAQLKADQQPGAHLEQTENKTNKTKDGGSKQPTGTALKPKDVENTTKADSGIEWTKTLLKEPYFHTLLWPCICVMGFRMSYLNNISTLLFSMGMSESRAIFILIPVVGTLSKPVIGYLADRFDSKVPRSLLLLVCTVILGLFCMLDIGFIDSIHFIAGTMFMAQLASSCVQTLGPPILIEYFGADAFSTGWGMVTVGFTLATVVLQLVLGLFYDFMVKDEMSHCFGVPCFLLYFWVNAVLIYFSCVFLGFLTHKLWSRLKNTAKVSPSST